MVIGKSIIDFCKSRGWKGTTYYYHLKELKLEPEELRLPGKREVYITPKAEKAWERRMASAKVQRQIALQQERRRHQARMANLRSIASPNHIANRRRRGEVTP